MTDSFNVGLGRTFSIPYLLVYKISKLRYNEKIILSKDPSVTGDKNEYTSW